MRIILITIMSVFVILTTSVAQIRYALTNPEHLVNLIINFTMIAAVFYLLVTAKRGRSRRSTHPYNLHQFSMVGTKGGKASRRLRKASV
jgi:large-conductance mechanosensitive channel